MPNNLQKSDIGWTETFAGEYSSATNGQTFGRTRWFGAGGVTAAVLSINGGGARIAILTDEDDAAQIFGPLAFEPDECRGMSMHARVRISDADKASVFIGWTDETKAEVPIEDEDGSLNTNASDAFGILLEGEQDTTWQTVGVEGDTDKAQTAIGAGTGDVTVPDYAVDSEWRSVFLEADAVDSGTLRVYLEDANGNLVLCATRTSFFDSSKVYAPVVSADGRASAYNLDVFEFGWHGQVGAVAD